MLGHFSPVQLCAMLWTAAFQTPLSISNKPYGAYLVAQMVKNLPAMWETQVQCLGQEGPLEKGMATHSSVLAWRIHMDRGVWQPTVHGVAKSQTQ